MQFFIPYWKETLSALAVIIATYSYIMYIRSIFDGKTVPHLFSWGIWALTTGIAFFAQVSGGWGWGSAQNGLSFFTCMLFAGFALKYGTKGRFHMIDWGSLFISLIAIGLWIYTDNPWYGSLFAMLADMIGYIPTFRKVWNNPETEPTWYYFLMNVKHGLSLVALSVYSWTTMIFSSAVIIINFLLILIQIIRKKK